MKSETKNIIIVFEFIIIISIFFIINILKPDDKISVYERRKLASFPEISLENIFEGNISNQLEEYAMDQFVSRDVFRKIKYYFNTNILKQKDTNKFFIKNRLNQVFLLLQKICKYRFSQTKARLP